MRGPRPGRACRLDHDGGDRPRPRAWCPWRGAYACGCARNGTWARERPPVSMSRAFPAGELAEIPGAGHFDLIDPQSEAWPQVLAALAGTFR